MRFKDIKILGELKWLNNLRQFNIKPQIKEKFPAIDQVFIYLH